MTPEQIRYRAQHIRADFLRRYGSAGVIARMLALNTDEELVRKSEQHHAETIARRSRIAKRAQEAKSVKQQVSRW